MDSISIDTAVTLVAKAFAVELQRFRTKTGRSSSWQSEHLYLQVSVNDKTEFSLRYSGSLDGQVKGARLGPLMNEVYRRAGFDDRQAGTLQVESQELMALPGPAEVKSGLEE